MWLPHSQAARPVWVPATVVSRLGTMVTVVTESMQPPMEVATPVEELLPINQVWPVVTTRDGRESKRVRETQSERCSSCSRIPSGCFTTQDKSLDDMVNFSHLHEAALLNNVTERYLGGTLYTKAGAILLALNPYQVCSGAR